MRGGPTRNGLGRSTTLTRACLQQYANVFDTVELNSSFYKSPDEGTILGLTRYTKRGFMFSAKINQKFTHELRLKLNDEAQGQLENFVQLFDPLLTQDRLGCFLIQLPPSLEGTMNFSRTSSPLSLTGTTTLLSSVTSHGWTKAPGALSPSMKQLTALWTSRFFHPRFTSPHQLGTFDGMGMANDLGTITATLNSNSRLGPES